MTVIQFTNPNIKEPTQALLSASIPSPPLEKIAFE